MKSIAWSAGLMVVLVLGTEGRAGGPPPVCMTVDKVVLEPNADSPTRIQIWGTFSLLEESKSKYQSPVQGYLYYQAPAGNEPECRKEWAKLRDLADKKKIVSFGMCGEPNVRDHLRKPTEKPAAPVPFPLKANGFADAEKMVGNYPALKALHKQ
jgi:hypothetical protein